MIMVIDSMHYVSMCILRLCVYVWVISFAIVMIGSLCSITAWPLLRYYGVFTDRKPSQMAVSLNTNFAPPTLTQYSAMHKWTAVQ